MATDDEAGRALRAGPLAVGYYVATAVGGKVQEVREVLALGAALHRALDEGPASDLVRTVVEGLLAAPLDPAGLGLAVGDRPMLLAAVAGAGAAAAAHPDGIAYRRWLMALAREVAHAASDGGLLGVGGAAFHPAEQAALAELAEALGLLGE